MSEDTSQTAPLGTETAVDTSRQETTPPSVAELAPANTDTPNNDQPPQATAGTPTPGDGGRTAVGVDTTELDSYKSEKAEFLAAPAPASAPASAPAPAPAVAEPAPTGEETETSRLPKMHIRPTTQEDLTVLDAWKTARKAGASESLVEFILKTSAPPPPVPAGETAPAADGTPSAVEHAPIFSTVEDLDAEIKRLTDEEFSHLENFDTTQAKRCRERAQDLMRYRPSLEAATLKAESIEMSAAEVEWMTDLARAQKVFADAGRPGSALETKATEIRQRWIAEGHALAHSPRSAVAIYAEAAAELGLAPASAAPEPVPSLSTPTAVHRPPAAIIAGGDARSQTSRAPDPSSTPLENYQAEKAALLASRRG